MEKETFKIPDLFLSDSAEEEVVDTTETAETEESTNTEEQEVADKGGIAFDIEPATEIEDERNQEDDSNYQQYLVSHTKYVAKNLLGMNIPEDVEIDDDYYATLVEEHFKSKEAELVPLAIRNVPEYLQPVVEIAINEQLEKEDFDKLLSQVNPQDALNFEEESNAEKYIRKYYTELGEDEDDIEDRLASYKDKGKLATIAQRIYDKSDGLKSDFIQERLEDSREIKKQREQEDLKFIGDFESEIKNRGYNLKVQRQIKEAIASNRLVTKLEEVFTKPKALATLTALVEFGFDGSDFQLEQFVKQLGNTSNKKTRKRLLDYKKTSPVTKTGKSRKQTNAEDKIVQVFLPD